MAYYSADTSGGFVVVYLPACQWRQQALYIVKNSSLTARAALLFMSPPLLPSSPPLLPYPILSHFVSSSLPLLPCPLFILPSPLIFFPVVPSSRLLSYPPPLIPIYSSSSPVLSWAHILSSPLLSSLLISSPPSSHHLFSFLSSLFRPLFTPLMCN